LTKILTVPERIRLFKVINRVHEAMYGWKIIYWNVWNGDRIDIESDIRFDSYHKKWIPLDKSDEGRYYFHDDEGRDISWLRGIFAWEAYNFPHLNPYKYHQYNEPVEEDFISDSLGKRIGPDVGHPIYCLETTFDVRQRKDDGKIWISSNWIYHYATVSEFGNDISDTLSEAARGDEKISEELRKKYEDVAWENGQWFKKALERYFEGGQLNAKYWAGGYLFTASKEWRIKTLEQFNEARDAEEKHFSNTLEEFIVWFKDNGISLGAKAEEGLSRRMRSSYAFNPRDVAERWCKLLVEEDKAEPSDVHLWWGGEPNRDSCYALLTLFFDIDPDDVGTRSFDDRVSRNLRALINIAEKDDTWLSSFRKYAPNVLRATFS